MYAGIALVSFPAQFSLALHSLVAVVSRGQTEIMHSHRGLGEDEFTSIHGYNTKPIAMKSVLASTAIVLNVQTSVYMLHHMYTTVTVICNK